MPSKRFENLPEEKQARIRQAALEELSRVPFSEVSINQIIRNAGIPRGSFYEYFEDKYDLLCHVLCGFRQAQQQHMTDSLVALDWDIFAVAVEILDHTLECADKTGFAYYKNIFVSLSPSIKGIREIFHLGPDEIAEMLMPHLPKMKLALRSQEELSCFVELLITLVLATTGMIFLDAEHKDEIRERFILKLEMLRSGVCENALPLQQPLQSAQA